jgi:CheY-like chemotaxis protein
MQVVTHRSWPIPLIVLSSLIVFIADYLFPVGYTVYVFYFIPILIAVLDHRAKTPYLVAALATLLVIAGWMLSANNDLIQVQVAQTNRSMKVLSLWFIAALVSRMIQSIQDGAEREWIKSRASELSLRLRGEKTVEQVGQELLQALAEFSDLKIGAIYYRHDHLQHLNFLAGHAFIPDEHKHQIKFGDGLLGQAARDQRKVEIHPLPDEHIKLSSVVGESKPSYLLIYPLMAEEELVAVAEYAYLTTPSSLVQRFLEQTSEIMAVALRSAQYKDKLAQLLQQSQQQSEELQAQQEELRVTNEELEAQARALKEAATRLENQQAELEQSNQQLEEQTQQLEQQKDTLDERNQELNRIRLDLEGQKKQLESSGRYKSEFLANMSHELRTPLNSSLILAKLLTENRAGNLSDEQVKYAETIYQSGNDLLNLINDVLDLAKVEAGKLNLHPEVFPPDRMADAMEKLFGPLARDKQLKLSIELSPDLPETIITDRQRLEQILKNFLSNALKFTEQGEVKLSITPHPTGISFAVSDTGIGIPEEQLQNIFEAFRQADGTINRKFGGTGLGLSISLELARLLGGEIKVSSQAGAGSTFNLHLPLEYKTREQRPQELPAAPVAAALVEKPYAAPGPVVQAEASFSFKDDRLKAQEFKRLMLIIEDDESFARILFDLAHEMDFGAIVAATADEGINLARRYLPQAIVLDIRLPDHNGLMVLDQLKMNPQTRHIPVHVMSGSDFSRSALEMGAAGYMMKPVKRDDLQVAFSNLASVTNQLMKQVLVVEDNDVQREHVVSLISDRTVKVDAVGTATEALEKLAHNTYDCMIMDLSLPDLSGHELLGRLSAESSNYSFPPVIVYTARDLTQEEEEKLRLYAGSIIIKGAKSPERLLSEVTLFLHKVETELPLERQKMLKDFRNRERNLEGRQILVVDDDVRNIFALTSVLENFGARLTVARNGREALEKLEQMAEIDLVLMDIMMPEMDGYEAITRIRAQKKYDELAIIALTAKAMKDDKERCIAVGANDYLPKPIDMDKLMSLIRVWLPVKRSFAL